MIFSDYRLNRLSTGKLIGLVFGIVAFSCSYNSIEAGAPVSVTFSWGLLLWYVVFGYAIAASINSIEYINKECSICIPWYAICIYAGFFLGLAIAMLTEKKMHYMLGFFTGDMLTSPYWLTIDSIFAALVIGFILKLCCKPKKD